MQTLYLPFSLALSAQAHVEKGHIDTHAVSAAMLELRRSYTRVGEGTGKGDEQATLRCLPRKGRGFMV